MKKSKFPQEVFPAEVEKYLKELAEKQGFCYDYLCSAFLILVSVCIGNRLLIKGIGSWYERPLIWVLVIGASGFKKSPAFKAVFEPIRNSEVDRYEKFKKELKEYLADLENDIKGDRPVFKQRILDDTTIEAMYEALKINDEGSCMIRDELIGLIKDSGRYSSNSEVERLMSIFSDEPITNNRKNAIDPEIIEHPFVSVYGGTQPAMLEEFFADGRMENGFVYRFLFCNPEDYRRRPARGEFDESLKENYEAFVSKLEQIPFTTIYGKVEPSIVALSKEAQLNFEEWQDDFLFLDSDPDSVQGFKSKLESYCLRIALLLECANHDFNESDYPQSISEKSMMNSIQICLYFYDCFIRTMPTNPERIPMLTKVIVDRLLKGESMYDIVPSLVKQGFKQSEICQASGIAPSSIYHYKKGKK